MMASESGRETVNPNEDAFIDRIVTLQRQLHDRSGHPVRRAQHPKHHGLCRGELVVEEGLPDDLRHGIFSEPRRYPVWLRYSNGRGDDDARPTLHGLAMKVMGVAPGKDQDFLMVDHPVFFIRDLQEYVALFEAQVESKGGFPRSFFFPGFNPLRWRLGTMSRFRAVRKRLGNLLGTTFFSATPYALGPHAIKFSLLPHGSNGDNTPPGEDANFLGTRLAEFLEKNTARFDVRVLVQADPARMPVEDPTVDWEEASPDSKWVKVATVHLPPQVPNAADRLELAEDMAFTPWNTLPEHRPLGGINRARRVVYDALRKDRLEANGLTEPATPPAEG